MSHICAPPTHVFAEGKKERLVYQDIRGNGPIVGCSIAAVSAVIPESDGIIYERVFYHDTHGQIYETPQKETRVKFFGGNKGDRTVEGA